MNTNKKYTTILFDADDTLLDFKKAEKHALVKILTELNLPATEEVTSRYSQINASLWREFEKGNITKEDIKNERYTRLFNEFGFSCNITTRQVNDRYLEFLGEGGFTINGAEKLCQRLKDSGFSLYIITNGVAKTQAMRLEKSGLKQFFNDVIVSETVGTQKPFIEFFNYAFDIITEKDKSKILVIGDSLGSDIKGANNAGLDCVWYNPEHRKKDSDLRIDFEIEKLEDIYKILGV